MPARARKNSNLRRISGAIPQCAVNLRPARFAGKRLTGTKRAMRTNTTLLHVGLASAFALSVAHAPADEIVTRAPLADAQMPNDAEASQFIPAIDPDAFAAALATAPDAFKDRPSAALAGKSPPQAATNWKRTENKDGSAKITVDRKIGDVWDAKVGVDFGLAAPADPALPPAEPLSAKERTSGVAWSRVAVPGPELPLGWDKTSIEARFDAAAERGKLSTTFSRSLPLSGVTVTLENSYSISQSLMNGPTSSAAVTPAAANAAVSASQAWGTEQALKFKFLQTDTTISAGATLSSVDNQWHHQLGAEQKIFGPLNVTTSVTDPGSPASNKKITAGFTTRW
jgi:hypothetical protein